MNQLKDQIETEKGTCYPLLGKRIYALTGDNCIILSASINFVTITIRRLNMV